MFQFLNNADCKIKLDNLKSHLCSLKIVPTKKNYKEWVQMTYAHLTTDELVLIASYFNIETCRSCRTKLNRSRQTIYNVYSFLKQGKSARLLPSIQQK